ncbi:MAG: arginine--tRNA ligase [Candidatus Campbellbacteria bacterium]
MQDVKKDIEKAVKDTCAEFGFPEANFVVERPADMSHGDYATNVALALSKQLGKNPRDIAQELAQKLSERKTPSIEAIETAGAGFINFRLSRDYFAQTLKNILADEKSFGKNDALAGKTVMVEYTQPNPFKPFHIGHLMSNTIGEALTRIFESSGANVIRANYQGDVGLHVAKALWGMMKKGVAPDDIPGIGEAYAYGHEMYETNEAAAREIVDLNKKVYAHDQEVEETYKKGRTATLDAFEKIYALLGTTFDEYFFESEVWEKGTALVEEGLQKNIFEKSDGAIIFPGEKHGLHTRVFITKEGVPTYEAKELGLAFLKTERCNFDVSLTITAVEQEQYFNVVFKALELLHPEFAGKFQHAHHGMMVLPSGKMSSRTGNVITGESLIADMIARAKEKVSERGVSDADKIAQDVAVGAIKYMVLKQNLGKNIVFDAEKSLSFEGDSGPYLQYTYTRANSILEKARAEGIAPSTEKEVAISDLERLCERFPEVVRGALEGRAPSDIVQYLISLSSEFNAWYATGRIVDAQDAESPYKVALTAAVAAILTSGLQMTGIPAPSRM